MMVWLSIPGTRFLKRPYILLPCNFEEDVLLKAKAGFPRWLWQAPGLGVTDAKLVLLVVVL